MEDAARLLREKHNGRTTPAAARDLARLRRGTHVSYLIGWAPFLGCTIDLSARPLIPRPETEFWTEQGIEAIRRGGKENPSVLDLYCGSGCIGIAVLKHIPAASVEFADIEPAYFKGIRKSLRLNRLDARRARCIPSDGLQALEGRTYDYILANPPYIPLSGRPVEASVLRQEPRRALFGGRDGLTHIRTLLREAKRHLAPGGILMIEFDPPQKAAIAAYAARHGWRARFFRDQYRRWRFVFVEADPRRQRTRRARQASRD